MVPVELVRDGECPDISTGVVEPVGLFGCGGCAPTLPQGLQEVESGSP